MRQNLKVIQAAKNLTKEMELIINNLENFICAISSHDSLDCDGKRDTIRRVVKK